LCISHPHFIRHTLHLCIILGISVHPNRTLSWCFFCCVTTESPRLARSFASHSLVRRTFPPYTTESIDLAYFFLTDPFPFFLL
jgi:hypothetical protein